MFNEDKRMADADDSPMALYRFASALENNLRDLMAHDPHALLAGEPASAFNRLIRDARQLAPDSIALREDVVLIDDEHEIAVGQAFRAVHITLIPAIHNAMPEAQYAEV